MIIDNENQLIELFKKKNLNEIKQIFNENQIQTKNMNQFNETLTYLVKRKSHDSIEFILEKRQKLNSNQDIDDTEFLFYSIRNNDFKTAKILLNNGARIDNKIKIQKILLNIY